MQTHRGISTVEVLVALVLFSLAALGSAGAVAMSARVQRTASARRAAVAALESAVGAIGATPCAQLADGERTFGAERVAWTVTRADTLVRVVLHSRHAGVHESLDVEVACP